MTHRAPNPNLQGSEGTDIYLGIFSHEEAHKKTWTDGSGIVRYIWDMNADKRSQAPDVETNSWYETYVQKMKPQAKANGVEHDHLGSGEFGMLLSIVKPEDPEIDIYKRGGELVFLSNKPIIESFDDILMVVFMWDEQVNSEVSPGRTNNGLEKDEYEVRGIHKNPRYAGKNAPQYKGISPLLISYTGLLVKDLRRSSASRDEYPILLNGEEKKALHVRPRKEMLEILMTKFFPNGKDDFTRDFYCRDSLQMGKGKDGDGHCVIPVDKLVKVAEDSEITRMEAKPSPESTDMEMQDHEQGTTADPPVEESSSKRRRL
ncbi:unnamed protein product [Amoebophrya sp. A25]|nr:unnamed protein product [Amoebophrya sp. A25]|eukprot:GSA25T00021792001.1